jgi:hypothetical protein
MCFRSLLILGALAGVAWAQLAERQPVAKLIGAGSIMRRESPARPWQLTAAKEELHAGDLLVAGTGAGLEGKNSAVRLLLQGAVGSPVSLPIIESAVVLHSSPDVDLDFALKRGRVDLVNQKAKGEAKVRVRGRDGTAELRLLEPGTRVALALVGRWLPGVPFCKDAKADHKPAQAFVVLVLKGEVEIKTARHQFLMRAPPGPALLEGDDIGDTDPSPRRLDKLPDWAAGQVNEDSKKVTAALARFQDLARKKSVAEALSELLQSEDPVERHVAVAMLGATDDIERLAHVLAGTSRLDTFEHAVPVIRHWIGREPGQDQKLYRALIDKEKLTAAQAGTVLQLLHNFGDDALTQPETYEGLLDLLDSDQQAVRGLAHWQLYRLVPPGRKIGYDPLATPEKRAAAVRKWRKLIPPGKLPPSK